MRWIALFALAVGGCEAGGQPGSKYPSAAGQPGAPAFVVVQEMDCAGDDTTFSIKPGALAHIAEQCEGSSCQSYAYSRDELSGTLVIPCGGSGRWARLASVY